MRKSEDKDILRVIAVFGGTFAILVGLAVGAIIFRSPDVNVEQDIFPIGLTVDPDPFPGVGMEPSGSATFTFDLTVTNPGSNPNLTLTVYVIPTLVENLTVSHCLMNPQENLSDVNTVCPSLEAGDGTYFANVTTGSSVTLTIQVRYVGAITEPVTVNWTFYAEGEEIP